MLRLGDIGSSKLDADSNVLLVQVENSITDDVHNDCYVYGALGVTSRPYPADDNGSVEAFFMDSGTSYTSIIAMRDTRCASIYGALKPGDTVLHSHGINQCAQVQLKDEKKQVVLVTETSDDKHAMVLLDGVEDKLLMSLKGYVIQISDDGIALTDKTGEAGIFIKDGTVAIMGKVVLGGLVPTAPVACFVNGAPASGTGVFVAAL